MPKKALEPVLGTLEPIGTYWNPLEPIGTHWKPLEPFGALWNPFEAFGTLDWNLHLEPYALEPVGILECLGTLVRNPMDICWILDPWLARRFLPFQGCGRRVQAAEGVQSAFLCAAVPWAGSGRCLPPALERLSSSGIWSWITGGPLEMLCHYQLWPRTLSVREEVFDCQARSRQDLQAGSWRPCILGDPIWKGIFRPSLALWI